MQDGGGVFDLARFTDDRRLAVTLRLPRRDAERVDAALAEQSAEFLADGAEFVEVLDVAAGAGVVDYRHGQRAAGRRLDRAAHLDADFVDLNHDLANLGRHVLPQCSSIEARPAAQRRPSQFLIALAASPPTRAWIRDPVLIARMKTSSSAAGAPGTRTSMASKWLRT